MARLQSLRPFISTFASRAGAPLLVAAALVFAPAAVLAQARADEAPIQQQMTPEQFKAAGLDKLSAQELANLNAWLGKTLEVETQEAATQAKQEARKEQQERRFMNFGAKKEIVAKLVGEFHGYSRGRTYTLDNGQVWVQTDSAELTGVHLTNPEVRIKPSVIGEAGYLRVPGAYSSATVRRIK
jgi:hypothetical protein